MTYYKELCLYCVCMPCILFRNVVTAVAEICFHCVCVTAFACHTVGVVSGFVCSSHFLAGILGDPDWSGTWNGTPIQTEQFAE